jgi:hypothetical protein
MFRDAILESFRFHHVGCAVRSIDDAIASLAPVVLSASRPVTVSSQKVRVCFLEMNPGVYLELVESTGDESAIAVMLKRGISFYHVGFIVERFDRAIEALAEQRYRHLQTFVSEAFSGRRCAFLMSETMQLIEVIEGGDDVTAP